MPHTVGESDKEPMLPVLPLPTCSAILDALPTAIRPEPETQAAAPLFSLREVTTAGREATEQKSRSLDDMRLDERWHALLWNHLDVAVGKAEDGLDNLQRLSKFVGKRVAAEKEVASSLLDMCQASKWGLKRDELLDVLRETGRMNEAWSMLVEKTKEICNAHMEVVERLTEEARVPIDAFLRDNTPRCAELASSGKAKQKELTDVHGAIAKAQLAYYHACTELDHADWLLHAKGKNNQVAIKKRDEARTKKKSCHGAYGENVKALNLTESMIAESVGGILSELRELELARLALTQLAMLAYAVSRPSSYRTCLAK
jgi:hypothetical protein